MMLLLSSALQTHQRLLDPSNYKIRYLDKVCVKGKEEAIQLYEVFDGDPPELQMLKLETQADLARAQELYYDKRFVDAQVELFKVLGAQPLIVEIDRSLEEASANPRRAPPARRSVA